MGKMDKYGFVWSPKIQVNNITIGINEIQQTWRSPFYRDRLQKTHTLPNKFICTQYNLPG